MVFLYGKAYKRLKTFCTLILGEISVGSDEPARSVSSTVAVKSRHALYLHHLRIIRLRLTEEELYKTRTEECRYTPLYIIDMLKYIFKAKSKDITNITATELLLLSVSIGMISGLVGYMIVNYIP